MILLRPRSMYDITHTPKIIGNTLVEYVALVNGMPKNLTLADFDIIEINSG